jgi:hypothetical protein
MYIYNVLRKSKITVLLRKFRSAFGTYESLEIALVHDGGEERLNARLPAMTVFAAARPPASRPAVTPAHNPARRGHIGSPLPPAAALTWPLTRL